MISDLFSFIVRFVILNPMALIGVCCGSYAMLIYGTDGVESLVTSVNIYGYAFIIALLYALLFKHIYYQNSDKIDWWATIKSSIEHMLTLLFAAACGMIIIYAINFGIGNKLDKYVRHEKIN